MGNFDDKKLFMFDLDGTVYHNDILIGDVKQTLITLRNEGKKIVYLTNNSSCTNAKYKIKLQRLGLWNEEDMVYSSLDCAIDYLTKNRKDKVIYLVGTKEVVEFCKRRGLKLASEETDNSLIDIVLLTFDKELDYKKMVKANELMVLGKEYISTHPDFVCPTDGISIPDAGSFIEMFKASNGKTPSLIIGKPNTFMAEYLLSKLGMNKEDAVMVGDRLYTDIQFGINSGITTILVLSGETTLEQLNLSNVKPNYVMQDVNQIIKN